MAKKEPTTKPKKSLAKLRWFYFDPHDGKMIPAIDEASARAAAKVLETQIYQAKNMDEARQMHEEKLGQKETAQEIDNKPASN